MFRANTSFSTELPDGTERSYTEGQVVSEEDPVAAAQPDFFSVFSPDPGAPKATSSRRGTAKR